MIRHIVIFQFQKGKHDNYSELLEDTKAFVDQIPNVLNYQIYPDRSKYVPVNVERFGVEVQLENLDALDIFMEHPKHIELKNTLIGYLADQPYMVLNIDSGE